MTGIFIGVKNNSFLKLLIKSDSSLTKESTILGTSMKSVEKISYRKMLNGIRKPYKNKENLNKLLSIISYHLHTIYPVSIQFS